jgi:hypothetical protein
MLVAWWFLSERFPRFLLAPAGLCAAFVPWALMAVPRRQRWLGAGLIAAAAVFSTLVTFNQALLPFARQPIDRTAFYDHVWAVDPAVQSLPESEGLWWQTGYAPELPEYAAYYSLLGPGLRRLVLPGDRESTTSSILDRMRQNGARYAYASASPQLRSQVEALFDPQYFEMVSQSRIVRGEAFGARRTLWRTLYRPADSAEEDRTIIRYLYRLK